jgi:AraC-like DNA-binding protein
VAVLVDTRAVSPHERFDYWTEASCRLFHPLEMHHDGPRPFSGNLTGQSLGQIQVFRLAADSCQASRTHRGIAALDPECLLVAVQSGGQCVVTQEGRTATLQQSDIVSYESSHPYTVQATTPFELVVFAIPRSVLGSRADPLYRQTAVRVTGVDGIGGLAAPFFLHIAERLRAGDVDERDFDLGESVLDLVRAVYTGRRDPAVTSGAAGRELMLARVKANIEAHLGDPDLSPAQIADANSMSVRYLYKLFEREETAVSEWIRHRRLDRSRRDIADPALSHETIFAIASRWGWASAAHFSRLFHATYGCSPREYRALARQGEGTTSNDDQRNRTPVSKSNQDRSGPRR